MVIHRGTIWQRLFRTFRHAVMAGMARSAAGWARQGFVPPPPGSGRPAPPAASSHEVRFSGRSRRRLAHALHLNGLGL